jgi:hypothetical protein
MSHPTYRQLARYFRLFGQIGLILQALLGIIPILVVIVYVIFQQGQPATGGLSFGFWLAIACLIMLLFSLYWCFRYIQLAHQLAHQDTRMTYSGLLRDLKLGLWVNIGIMGFSMLIALIRVGELTIKLLFLPQGATVISPNPLGTSLALPGTLITPSNLIAIQAMLNVIAAGLVGVIITTSLFFFVEKSRQIFN